MARLLGVAAAIELLYWSLPRTVDNRIIAPDITWFAVAPIFCLLIGLAVTVAVHVLLKLVRAIWLD